jgi:hypothetical protein
MGADPSSSFLPIPSPAMRGRAREGADQRSRLYQRERSECAGCDHLLKSCGVRRAAPYLTFPRRRGKERAEKRNEKLSRARGARKARQDSNDLNLFLSDSLPCNAGEG